MNSNIILELREKDSVQISNGSYETNLSVPITINEGDTILMKQCMIDTISTSNQLVIPDDITLIIHNGLYVNDWKVDATNKIEVVANNGDALGAGSGYGGNHIPYKETGTAILPGYNFYTGWNYTAPSFTTDAVEVTYQYINSNGNLITFYSKLPKGYQSNNEKYFDPCSILAKTGSFIIAYPPEQTLSKNGWISNGDQPSTEPVTDAVFTPYIFETNITINKGSYNPADLAIAITESLSRNGNNLKTMNGIVDSSNNFLKSSTLFDVGKPQPDGSTGNIANAVQYIADDGNRSFNFTATTANYWIGSSEIALEYDPATDKFNFTFLHMPQFNSSGVITVLYEWQNGQVGSNVFASAKNGGIFFEGLSAIDSKGNFFDFWSGVLGFDVSTLCVKYTTLFNVLNLPSSTILIPNFIDGVSTTNGFYGLASAVKVGGDYYQAPALPVQSTIDNTLNIISNKTTAELINTYSHFLIEADLKFQNNMFGINTTRGIQGIVSKYYSLGSYTFGDSSNSIQYTHSGNSLILKSVRVRILTSDKKLDPNIGDDNTVYFQIIKAGSK
jgi:hypothetical protein